MRHVSVDRDRCQGHGRCLLEAPDVFDVTDIGKVELLTEEIDDNQVAEVQGAVTSCPERVITLHD